VFFISFIKVLCAFINDIKLLPFPISQTDKTHTIRRTTPMTPATEKEKEKPPRYQPSPRRAGY
jgi:hypothetical protein